MASRNRPHSGTSLTAQLAWVIGLMAAVAIAWGFKLSLHHSGPSHAGAAPPQSPPHWPIGIVSFVILLGCIAFLPLLKGTERWWHANRNKLLVSGVLSLMTLAFVAFTQGSGSLGPLLTHAVLDEYVPFIVLLFSLYVISGGISLQGDLPAHPATNTAFLAFGALIASVVGTTGASMLLIRPLLQTNSERRHVVHTVVFFIFLVSNIGGCLLPIGDPPLFLGYLKGVPFQWTMLLWKEWAFCCVVLLVVYFIWDTLAYRRETRRDIGRDERIRKPLRVRGLINLVWLSGVVLCVALINDSQPLPGTNWTPPAFLRELVMLSLVATSLLTTPAGVREDNRFDYAAIIEVAALFIGVFITMQVPLTLLKARGAELGIDQPWEFFWITGGLSSLLDNAPTYLVFFQIANTLTHSPGPGILTLLTGEFIREDLLVAVSLGAVFMGANTYIGNGPNFMVKAIAEQSGVKMPSFLGYLFRYALPILIPLFVILTLLFLRQP